MNDGADLKIDSTHHEEFARIQAGANRTDPGFGGCLPTAEQTLLLRAVVWQGKDAVASWEEWQARVDLDTIDAGSKRLFPQLYFNLRALGIAHPWMEKFKEVYRTAWLENQKHFERAAPALRALNAAGIPSMSRRRNCWDNAPMENFFGHLKAEAIHPLKLQSLQQAQGVIDDYIYFYNHERIQLKTILTPYELRCRYR